MRLLKSFFVWSIVAFINCELYWEHIWEHNDETQLDRGIQEEKKDTI